MQKSNVLEFLLAQVYDTWKSQAMKTPAGQRLMTQFSKRKAVCAKSHSRQKELQNALVTIAFDMAILKVTFNVN